MSELTNPSPSIPRSVCSALLYEENDNIEKKTRERREREREREKNLIPLRSPGNSVKGNQFPNVLLMMMMMTGGRAVVRVSPGREMNKQRRQAAAAAANEKQQHLCARRTIAQDRGGVLGW